MRITKAVIPAAGLGTRFLPFTKTIPKEMLPLFSKPAIHYIVQEVLQSGLSCVVFVSNKERDALMHYFDPSSELNTFLQQRSKLDLIADLNKIIETTEFMYIRQHEPRGLGHAVLQAQFCISRDEYFAVLLPDDFIIGEHVALTQLMAVAQKHDASVIAVREIPPTQVSSYGIVAIQKWLSDDVAEIGGLVEKPDVSNAPSNLAIVGRYILSGSIFPYLQQLRPSSGQEIQLTDAIASMAREGNRVIACKIKGDRYDIGTPLGWFEAMVAFGIADKNFGVQLKEFLKKLVLKL